MFQGLVNDVIGTSASFSFHKLGNVPGVYRDLLLPVSKVAKGAMIIVRTVIAWLSIHGEKVPRNHLPTSFHGLEMPVKPCPLPSYLMCVFKPLSDAFPK